MQSPANNVYSPAKNANFIKYVKPRQRMQSPAKECKAPPKNAKPRQRMQSPAKNVKSCQKKVKPHQKMLSPTKKRKASLKMYKGLQNMRKRNASSTNNVKPRKKM